MASLLLEILNAYDNQDLNRLLELCRTFYKTETNKNMDETENLQLRVVIYANSISLHDVLSKVAELIDIQKKSAIK